ncbi:restriction endonuclease subunit S [Rhodoblastus sp. 17X3]|uniref:restriction endonuclease subunit S n=1 Tax=Rhodoblastus sp. 17X3 TaxID=3047026 RepID=UPI0024B841EE|nr:restriction endonuclease subunit S [Rhodoblastus sp. 17X3]MDI9849545.1 restriction endonuclease subunit S [Rhodoblastus sp. 17X3]
MKTVPLSAWVDELESGARPKGGIKEGAGEIPSLGAEHLSDDGGFNFAKDKRIPDGFFRSMTKGRIQPNDILIVKDGATTGKVSFVTGDFPYEEAAINEHVFRLGVSRKKADPRFVFRYLQSPLGQQQIMSDFRGATVGGIGRTFLDKVFLPDVTPTEQNRIATILDKADAIRRKREHSLIVADDFLRAVFLDMFGDPTTNPKGLEQRTLSACARFSSGGTPSKAKTDYWSGAFPWVSPKDMKVDVILDSEDHVSETVFEQTSLKKIPPGTPLIVVRGMILVHTVPMAMTAREVAINQDMKAIHFDDDIDPMFGFWCLKVQHEAILARVETAAHGTKRLDTDRLGEVPITVPDSDAQQEFLAIMNKFNIVRAAMVGAWQEASTLFLALSQRAFRGQL